MIREAAALRLVRDLFPASLQIGDSLAHQIATVIQQAVEIDELNQEIERLTKGDNDGKRGTENSTGG